MARRHCSRVRDVYEASNAPTHPLTLPDQAPVAEPGFTNKRLSYSSAWNLAKGEMLYIGLQRRDARMCMTRDKDIYVHLSRERTERVEVSGGNALVTVYDPDFDGAMVHCHRHGERRLRALVSSTSLAR